uniref:Pseudouridine-5'-phosphatase n=1 Tax=Prolemur simus TaxID=1328070 RepID=A0A8C9AV21_PROSS
MNPGRNKTPGSGAVTKGRCLDREGGTMLCPVTRLTCDTDGLLLGTEGLCSVVFRETCGHSGKNHTWDVQSLVRGKKVPEALQIVTDVLEPPLSKEELGDESQAMLKELSPRPRSCQGSGSASFEMRTSRHKEFFGLFPHVVLGDDLGVKSGKPEPDIFLACAKRLSPPPPVEQGLVFEDAPNGLQVALAAGMQAVTVLHGPLSRDLTAKATPVPDSLQDSRPSCSGCIIYIYIYEGIYIYIYTCMYV